MKAFVTGITGFDGNYLGRLLLDNGVEVFGVARSQRFDPFLPALSSAVRYRQLNVEDRAALKDALEEIRPDLIFHLAAASSPSKSVSQPRLTYQTNLDGTFSLLEAVRLLNLPCRILVVSSSLVYGGLREKERASESFPFRPETPYAGSKATAELVAYQYWRSYGTEVVRVRPFNHTGPGQKLGFLCPDSASKLAEIEAGIRPPVLKVSGPRTSMDFSDVRDIVRGYHSALIKGQPGQVYNLCSGTETTVETVSKLLAAGVSCPVRLEEERHPAMREVSRLVGDSARAGVELGWSVTIPLQQTLEDVLDFWRDRVRTALAQQSV
ncbi:MAG TPA: GDP-mannose 4,6-dehydratase [Terriglobia bacterium]|nr:GDP-mannose 4,6-dehydratase [Terriglobia bacterium]